MSLLFRSLSIKNIYIVYMENIKIVGAINIDNEFTREYAKSMQEFSKTFKPLQTNSIIEPNKSDISKKYRKTRKRSVK